MKSIYKMTFLTLIFYREFFPVLFIGGNSIFLAKQTLPSTCVSFAQWITNWLPHSNKLLDNRIISIQLVV